MMSPLSLLRKKERINYKQRLQHILTALLFGKVGGNATFLWKYNHRDTTGTPIHKIPVWETGLPERWYILVDLLSGEVVPLTDYSRQYNIKQS